MPLLFSNAIYGMRGTTGGVVLELGTDSSGWRAVLEPVWSDFPGEDDRWPEVAETLAVQWTAPGLDRGLLAPAPGGVAADNRLTFGDSLSLSLRCDSAYVLRWQQGGRADTVRLERRRTRGWPS